MAIKLQAVISSWKNFNLAVFQEELDERASQVTDKQEESDLSRKKLVEQLKDFKKSASEETCKQSAALIKSFQNEVDFLSKRSKAAEISFLKLYQKFLDIVDPLPSMEYCVGLEKKLGALADLEIENKTIKETLEDYNEELKEVRNQDVTIKNLKEKLRKYEDQLENTLQNRIKEVEQNLIQSYSDKEQLLNETHDTVVKKIQESENRNLVLQQSLDQTQSELFEIKSKYDDGDEAKAEEVDMLVNDLERANAQVSSLQKQVAKIAKENEFLQNDTHGNSSIETRYSSIEYSALEAEISGKDKEITQLIEEINCLQGSIKKLKENSLVELKSLHEELAENKNLIANYEKKLTQQKDYDEVKRELTIIKSVEFNSLEDLNSKPNANNIVSKPLELLLLEKNKGLQKDNMALKLSNQELKRTLESLMKCNEENDLLVTEQRNLITQLESDLLSIQSMTPECNNELREESELQLLSEALKDVNNSDNDTVNTDTSRTLSQPELLTAGGSSQSATESLLAIVSSQRERFRIQNDKLEADMSTQNSQLLLLQNELDTLRGDNIKLYEKIRFLQSYQSSYGKASDSLAAESKYVQQYESNLDPFDRFSKTEKHRKYTALSPFEKVTLSFGRFVLKDKRARTASFLYLAFLHVLIFLVLYKFALTESFKRDFSSDCAKKFEEHMHDVHGEN